MMNGNFLGAMSMSLNLQQILEAVDKMTADELRLLYREIVRKLAIPLQDPADVFDDWDDPEVDAAYAKSR